MAIKLPEQTIYEQSATDSNIHGVAVTVQTTLGNCTFLGIKAHGALTALTPYKVAYSGTQADNPTTADLADSVTYSLVCVPPVAIASGAYGWVQIKGPMNDVVCASDHYDAGDGVLIIDGGLLSTDAAYGNTDVEFAIACETGDTQTALDLYLVGREVLETT